MSLSQTNGFGSGQPPKTRIVILGGGFGGVTTARRLERLCKRRRGVEIVLVSRDNFLLMTPLLFEVCSGALDARHCSFPIRAFLRTTRFVGNSGMGTYHGEWGFRTYTNARGVLYHGTRVGPDLRYPPYDH